MFQRQTDQRQGHRDGRDPTAVPGLRLILASASPARLQLLNWAGLAPEVMPSRVAEDGVADLSPRDAALTLAQRKAESVAAELTRTAPGAGAIVIGCDSLLEFSGEGWGKPASPAEAAERWRRLRGNQGYLHTGHCLVDIRGPQRRTVAATDTALVRFGHPTDREIEAYASTDEALSVAGPFTLEGLSAPWIESIDGNYGTITGISLPLLRRLLLELDVELVDLWS